MNGWVYGLQILGNGRLWTWLSFWNCLYVQNRKKINRSRDIGPQRSTILKIWKFENLSNFAIFTIFPFVPNFFLDILDIVPENIYNFLIDLRKSYFFDEIWPIFGPIIACRSCKKISKNLVTPRIFKVNFHHEGVPAGHQKCSR